MNNIRLQKYLSICGVASRRKSEDLIKEGLVKINGNIVTKLGIKVKEDDIVEYNNKRIKPEEKHYIALNKPAGYICSNYDKFNSKTIYDIIKIKKLKLFSLGRLDIDSSGLIILTNDGDFANKIIHPSSNISKVYLVESYEKPDNILKQRFINGIKINNILYKAIDVIKTDNKNIYKIILNEGKKREIREVYKYFGLKIKKLQRIAIGGLSLDSLKIKEGEYKILDKSYITNKIYNKKLIGNKNER